MNCVGHGNDHILQERGEIPLFTSMLEMFIFAQIFKFYLVTQSL
jgi:hypothetical protein